MTEKEKMLSGAFYNSRDPELIEMYHSARKLLKRFNHLDSEKLEERQRVLSDLLGHRGEGVWVEAPFYCDYGIFISIGKNTFINANCMLIDNNKITIGENGLIAPFVQIYTAEHPLKASDRIRHEEGITSYLTSTRPVTIGDNVWIGGNSVIFPGVTIGDNVTNRGGECRDKRYTGSCVGFRKPVSGTEEFMM